MTRSTSALSEATERDSSVHCPECGTSNFYRSQRRNLRERFHCWRHNLLPYRCKHCDKRFFAPRLKRDE